VACVYSLLLWFYFLRARKRRVHGVRDDHLDVMLVESSREDLSELTIVLDDQDAHLMSPPAVSFLLGASRGRRRRRAVSIERVHEVFGNRLGGAPLDLVPLEYEHEATVFEQPNLR
jgi:hypothetical protein